MNAADDDIFADLRAVVTLNGDRPWVAMARGPRWALRDVAAFADAVAPGSVCYLSSALRLPEAPPGALVVVGLDAGTAGWLNLHRNALKTARLRTLVWLPVEDGLDLRRVAPDLDSWIGSWVDLPGAAPPSVVARLRAAPCGRVSLSAPVDPDTLEAAWPGTPWTVVEPARDPSEPLPEGGIRFTGLFWEGGLRRALRQLAWSAHAGPVLLEAPLRVPSGFARVDPTCLPWPAAAERLRAAGHPEPDAAAARAGGLVQDLDGEPLGAEDLPPWTDLDEAAGWAARAAGDDSERWASLLLGQARAEGEAAFAAAVARGWVADRTARLGPDDPRTVDARFELAVALRDQGKLHEAAYEADRVREMRRQSLGADHPATWQATELLASLHLGLGFTDLQLAVDRLTLEQMLAAGTRFLGPEHPDTLRTLQNLAHVLYAQGDLAGARSRYEQALEAQTRLLGPEHRDTLVTLQDLAGTLHAQGDLAGARARYEQVLEAQTRLLGPEHPDTLGTLQNLAGTLRAQGDLAGARARYEQALEAMTRLLGSEHPDTTTTRFNLVLTLRQLDPPAATPHLEVLRRLSDRDPATLSAVERQILERVRALDRR